MLTIFPNVNRFSFMRTLAYFAAQNFSVKPHQSYAKASSKRRFDFTQSRR